MGLWNTLFGKKISCQFRDETGNLVEQSLSEAQFKQLQQAGAISQRILVKAHVLDPRGDYSANWEVGKDISGDAVEQFRDLNSGDIYAVTTYQGGEPTTRFCAKEQWLAIKSQVQSVSPSSDKEPEVEISALTTAVLLHEIESSDSMPRTFFGERILIELFYVKEGWFGRTCSISRFSPKSLPIGAEVLGPTVSDHHVISQVMVGDDVTDVYAEQISKSGTFALMISPRDEPGTLTSANLFCPNIKCVNVCSLTHTQTIETLYEMKRHNPSQRGEPKISWSCNLCGAEMLVDESSFDGLYKL